MSVAYKLLTTCSNCGAILVDFNAFAAENCLMSTDVVNAADPVELADSQAVIEHLVHGGPLDPDVRRRVQERAAEITERFETLARSVGHSRG
jgi:hypothetical protein